MEKWEKVGGKVGEKVGGKVEENKSENIDENRGVEEEKYGIGRYFLLTVLLSVIGWAFETGYIYLTFRRVYNTGFMTLPLCPIYGCSLLAAYLFIGTPDGGGLFLKKVKSKSARYPLYLLFAFLIPTVAELLVGIAFDKGFGVQIWSYSAVPMNFKGYICLPVSIIWSGLIFLFMKFVFLRIMRAVGKLPKMLANGWAFILLFILLVDFSLNLARLIY